MLPMYRVRLQRPSFPDQFQGRRSNFLARPDMPASIAGRSAETIRFVVLVVAGSQQAMVVKDYSGRLAVVLLSSPGNQVVHLQQT